MAEQRKRLSKKASKILFEIICEDSFEGKSIKTALPATRRISKAREGMWKYILSELSRRSGEEYDLGTISAAWYYNLRKIGSCLDQIDSAPDGGVALEKLRTLEKYVCSNLGDRIRGRGRVKGEAMGDDDAEKGEDDRDVKLTVNQMAALSRQSTMDASVNYSFDVVTLKSLAVKTEKESSNEEKRNTIGNSAIAEEDGDTRMEDIEMREDERMDNDVFDPLDLVETPIVQTRNGTPLNSAVVLPLNENPVPSRYNTAETTPISRNNSSMSVSGYDADNEKGLIKRRRKELKKRGDREKERGRDVKVEEEEVDEEEIQKKEEENGDKVDGEDEEEIEDEDAEEREERSHGEERNQKMKMLDNLKGMIENLRDHIVSLRIIGAIDAIDMETLADSFENAGKSVINNKDIL